MKSEDDLDKDPRLITGVEVESRLWLMPLFVLVHRLEMISLFAPLRRQRQIIYIR